MRMQKKPGFPKTRSRRGLQVNNDTEKLNSDIRVRMSSTMRAILDLYAEDYGYTSMSKFCRDLLSVELERFAESHGLT